MDPGFLLVIAGAAVGSGGLLLALSARRVPEGTRATVERFGRYRRTLRPGLRWLVPGAERIGRRLDLRERHLDLPPRAILTRDRVRLSVDAVCFYQVVDAARAAYEVDDPERALAALLDACLRTLVGARDLETLLSDRPGLNAALLAAADDAAATWGLQLTRTEVRDLRPQEALLDAVQEEFEARLRRRARILEAEGARRAAEAVEQRAESDARAARRLSEVGERGGHRTLDYLLARRCVDTLAQLADTGGDRVVLLPLDRSVLTSFEGVRTLAAAAGAGTTPARPEPATPEAVAEAIAEALADPDEGVRGAPPAFGEVADGRTR